MADWKEVAGVVGKVAPLLGSVLGGPVGAIAGAAGSLIASAVGAEPEPEAVLSAVRANPEAMVRLRELEVAEREKILEWRGLQLRTEQSFEASLTKRHEADLRSDSWLSKNVRPLCLLAFTGTLVAAVLMQEVGGAKLEALTDLGYGIYGYYFLGRSVFDKGAVRLRREDKA